VPLGHELHPVDEVAVGTLSRGHKREEPVPQKEPAGMEKVDNVEHRGVARESHCCIEGRWGGKATTLGPMVVVEEQEGCMYSILQLLCNSMSKTHLYLYGNFSHL
jgi:hypothetical protein